MLILMFSLLVACRTKAEVPLDTQGETAACVAEVEVCDGADNDCDGLVDAADADVSDAGTWFSDADGDGYGAAGTGQVACEQSEGWVVDSSDCDDADPAVHPAADEVCDDADNDCDSLLDGQDSSLTGDPAWFEDEDGDGFGSEASAERGCDAPPGTAASGDDCDDADPTVHPAADEVCNDVDDDCDGLPDGRDDSLVGAPTWYADADNDGYGDATDGEIACNSGPDRVGDSTDCDDSTEAVNPGATEVCDDLDNDCDALIDDRDDSLSDGVTWYADADGDGYGDATTTTVGCSAPANFVLNAADCDDADATVGRCDGGLDDGTVCAGRWGADDGQVPVWTGACDSTAGFTSYGGRCYYAVNTTVSDWDDARATCAIAGGSLAIVTDAAESAFIYGLAGRAYVGGCDDDVEGVWTWVNGEAWLYEEFGSGEPNDSSGTEECLEITTASGGWNDIWCDYNSFGQHYVCEFE